MNILFLSRRFYPDIGGVEKHIEELSKVLILKGHSVTVITQSKGENDKIDKIKIIRIEDSLSKIKIWREIWKNKKAINNADIVHAHDVYFWYFPFRFIFFFKKSFVTFHGYESYPIRKNAIFIRKISEKMSNGNIVIGEFIKKWYRTKTKFVSYGGAKLPSNLRTSKNNNSALFIGRLDEHTGILDYVEAVLEIRKTIPSFQLDIIGEGKYENRLQKFEIFKKTRNADFYYQRYNFAFVSRYLSILEAFANKNLVFAIYDNPIKRDYLKMTPFSKFMIISNDPKEIQKMVLYYLKNPKQKNKLINGAYEWVKNNSWETVSNLYLRLWNT